MKKASWIVAVAIILGCGGSGITPIKEEQLGGTIDTDTFNVPAGQTVRAVSDLTINASEDIIMDGTFLIDSGVQVIFVAQNEIAINGSVADGTAESSAGARAPNPPKSERPMCMISQKVIVRRDISLSRGRSVLIASREPGGTVTINSAIDLLRGPSARTILEEGGEGGSILIGGPKALQLLGELKQTAVAPVIVSINADLTAGSGGLGADDLNGTTLGDTVRFRPTAGGNGGSIEIGSAGAVKIGAVILMAGAGGSAGHAGRARSAREGHAVVPDSTQDGVPGLKIDCLIDTGGDAGKVSISGNPLSNSSTEKTADGGADSSLFVRAARGGAGAKGSDVIVSHPLNRTAYNSKGKQMAASTVLEILGGHGGPGTLVNAGGQGGSLNGSANLAGRTFRITLDDAFRGGDGFNGCSVSSTTPGTDGGAGGSFSIPVVPELLGRAMNGGDGGSYGSGFATKGGAAGTSGKPGVGGRPCSESKYYLSMDNEVHIGLEVIPPGTKVPMSRVRGGHFGQPEAGCDYLHLHGDIWIDGYGPIPDPNQTGCGHGHLDLQ